MQKLLQEKKKYNTTIDNLMIKKNKIIDTLVEKYENKLYKQSNYLDDIDIDDIINKHLTNNTIENYKEDINNNLNTIKPSIQIINKEDNNINNMNDNNKYYYI